MAIPNRLSDGFQLLDATLMEQLLAIPMMQNHPNIVALAGGGRGAGVPVLTPGFNHIATVASGSDSVMLPPAVAGTFVMVYNAGGNAAQVFGNSGNGGLDTIMGTAGATGVALASGGRTLYWAYNDGLWASFVSA